MLDSLTPSGSSKEILPDSDAELEMEDREGLKLGASEKFPDGEKEELKEVSPTLLEMMLGEKDVSISKIEAEMLIVREGESVKVLKMVLV